MGSFNDMATEDDESQASTSENRGDGEINVSMAERLASGTSGVMIAYGAIGKPALQRLVLGLIAGTLMYRAINGSCPVYKLMGITAARRGGAGAQAGGGRRDASYH